jgi:hypothetical protein
MKANNIRFLLIPLSLFLLFLSSAYLHAYDYEVIFLDDFQNGSTQNWLLENGEWSAQNYEFCVLECSS